MASDAYQDALKTIMDSYRGMDYGGAKYDVNYDGNGNFSGTIDFGYRNKNPGFHIGSIDTWRWVRAHPGEEDAFDRALLYVARKERSKIEQDVRDRLFSEPSGRLMWEAFGYGDEMVDEFEKFDRVDLKFKWFDEVKASSRGDDRWVPVVVTFKAHAVELRKLSDRPFSDMSDSQLDAIIWEVEGPEGVTADGEIPQWQMPERLRGLRDHYRRMSPRQQEKTLERYKKWTGGRFAASSARVATRFLVASPLRLQPDYGSDESDAALPRGKDAALSDEQKKRVHDLLLEYKGKPVPDKPVHDLADEFGIETDFLESYIYGIASKHLMEQSKKAFNKYDPAELLHQLVDLLDKYELQEAVRAVKQITPVVQDAWSHRER